MKGRKEESCYRLGENIFKTYPKQVNINTIQWIKYSE